ncbi:PREDICTED: ankyrin-2-like [Priapulus caudatus]|uniref:Ankyrin-2-like n=1 Tax=Priapulus caudatus TaxID=37621 RepID=A0ABM1DZB7_PRICU|nr:PREDICTED: ankyrin-2-like [Priapulus caudatus]
MLRRIAAKASPRIQRRRRKAASKCSSEPDILDDCDDGTSEGNASFLRAARNGNLEKVLEYLKGSTDINTSNANGLNALHLASKEGHEAIINELLKRGANVNASTKKGNTALHIASLAGQEEIVKILIQNGASVNQQSSNGFTPLYMAAQENHDKVVKVLLAAKANQSIATEDGFTPLAVALQQGHEKVVTVLLENDTRGKVRLPALHIAAKKDDCKAAALLLQSEHEPDVTSKSGFTPLHIAAHYGNTNVATLLISRGANINYCARHGITPLHVSAKWGRVNMVTLLLGRGAAIDSTTRDGLTPLHCAARSGHYQVVDVIVEHGAPISAQTKNGLTPLHMAAQGDHVEAARVLLAHRAPVDDRTVDFLTALHIAAHYGHVKVAKLLLEWKCEVNARALNGFTPLHIACKKNRIKVVELLLKYGASIEAQTESGLTPLHVASFMGCMNIVLYLLQKGSSPDTPTMRGETALHLAARANQTDIIRILLRNGANVDAHARENQTPLHVAARLGNSDIVMLLLQHGASVDAVTNDNYTALHIAAKEGQEEVASILLDQGANIALHTKKGFTPLHLAAKYGNMKVAKLLIQRDAPIDAEGMNGVTPLHVAAHYDHINVALLLLESGASPHTAAKNGYTPLHIAAKKNQMDIATTLLEYGGKPNAESKAGYTPLHLTSQEGHSEMASLLLENGAEVNCQAKNGLTPMHLCAQEDKVPVAAILVKHGAAIDPQTKAGYTPLHVASHFGQINMIRFLLQHGASVDSKTEMGYTPLHQAAQQGHTLVINLLLQHKASPNALTDNGQSAISIAQRLGYISVVETLKVVTETTIITTTTTTTEEKYQMVSPETMQETFLSDTEDEGEDIEYLDKYGRPISQTRSVLLPYIEDGTLILDMPMYGEDTFLGDASYRYLTTDEMKSLGDDSVMPDHDTKQQPGAESPLIAKEQRATQQAAPPSKMDLEKQREAEYNRYNQRVYQPPAHTFNIDKYSDMLTRIPSPGEEKQEREYPEYQGKFEPDNITVDRTPVHVGFLVSFMVDARGGAMRGCRHSGVRIIIPPRKAPAPMRITCKLLKKEKIIHPPPLMEGEALASRVLEMGPSGAKFLGPVIIEVPHFASLRGREREITILRSDNGESWREHTLEATENAVQDVLNESFEGEELDAIEDLHTNRITRILTNDFPVYFAIVTRVHQENRPIGPEGGMVSSTVVPQVQAMFPEGALTKKIRVGLQAQPIPSELVAKRLGNRVAVSPIVTVEPRRRKFHKPITLTIPLPQAASKGMINQYSNEAAKLRLLCSITGGSTPAQWEDITGTTPLTFVNDCVSFTTTVSARFWLMDCQQTNEAGRLAGELYREAIHVPFMAKFVVFAKRTEAQEGALRVFCMTDDKMEKTLECQEHFTEVARSRDVEVLEDKPQFIEMAGNLVPVTKSGEQLLLHFFSFQENRLPFIVRVRDAIQEALARIAFMKEQKVGKGEPAQTPICNLNIMLPDYVPLKLERLPHSPSKETVTIEKKYEYLHEMGIAHKETITKAELKLSDIARQLQDDWVMLALQLDITETQIQQIKEEHPSNLDAQAFEMLKVWRVQKRELASGNALEKALRKINRDDIVRRSMHNVELVTDQLERAAAEAALDQSGFDALKEELGPSRDTSLARDTSLDISYDNRDTSKERDSDESDKESVKEKGDEDQREPWIVPEYCKPRHGYQFRKQLTAEEKMERLEKLCQLEATEYVVIMFKSKPGPGDSEHSVEEEEVVPVKVVRHGPALQEKPHKPPSSVIQRLLEEPPRVAVAYPISVPEVSPEVEEGKEEVEEEPVVPRQKEKKKGKVVTEEVFVTQEEQYEFRSPTLATEEPSHIDESYREQEPQPEEQTTIDETDRETAPQAEEKPFTPPPTPITQEPAEEVKTTTKTDSFVDDEGDTVTKVTKVITTTRTYTEGDHSLSAEELAEKLASEDGWEPEHEVSAPRVEREEFVNDRGRVTQRERTVTTVVKIREIRTQVIQPPPPADEQQESIPEETPDQEKTETVGVGTDVMATSDVSVGSEQVMTAEVGTQADVIITQEMWTTTETTTTKETSVVPATSVDASAQTTAESRTDNIEYADAWVDAETADVVDTGVGSGRVSYIDARSGFDYLTTVDMATSPPLLEVVDSGVGSGRVSYAETGTDADHVPRTSDAGTGPDADSLPTADAGTGTDCVEMTDAGTGSSRVSMIETGTGSARVSMIETGTGSARVSTIETGSDADETHRADVGSETTTVKTAEAGVGGRPTVMTDSGCGPETVEYADRAVSPTVLATAESATATEEARTADAAAGPDRVARMLDSGCGPEAFFTAEVATATEQGGTVDAGSGPEAAREMRDVGSSAKEEAEKVSVGVAAAVVVETLESGFSPDAPPDTADTGVDAERTLTRDTYTEVIITETVAAATATESPGTHERATEVDVATTEASTETEAKEHAEVDCSVQTEEWVNEEGVLISQKVVVTTEEVRTRDTASGPEEELYTPIASDAEEEVITEEAIKEVITEVCSQPQVVSMGATQEAIREALQHIETEVSKTKKLQSDFTAAEESEPADDTKPIATEYIPTKQLSDSVIDQRDETGKSPDSIEYSSQAVVGSGDERPEEVSPPPEIAENVIQQKLAELVSEMQERTKSPELPVIIDETDEKNKMTETPVDDASESKKSTRTVKTTETEVTEVIEIVTKPKQSHEEEAPVSSAVSKSIEEEKTVEDDTIKERTALTVQTQLDDLLSQLEAYYQPESKEKQDPVDERPSSDITETPESSEFKTQDDAKPSAVTDTADSDVIMQITQEIEIGEPYSDEELGSPVAHEITIEQTIETVESQPVFSEELKAARPFPDEVAGDDKADEKQDEDVSARDSPQKPKMKISVDEFVQEEIIITKLSDKKEEPIQTPDEMSTIADASVEERDEISPGRFEDKPFEPVEEKQPAETSEVAPPEKPTGVEEDVVVLEEALSDKEESGRQDAVPLPSELHEERTDAGESERLDDTSEIIETLQGKEQTIEENVVTERAVVIIEEPAEHALEAASAEVEEPSAVNVDDVGQAEPLDVVSTPSEKQELMYEEVALAEESASFIEEPEAQQVFIVEKEAVIDAPERVDEKVEESVSVSEESEKQVAEIKPDDDQEQLLEAGEGGPLLDATAETITAPDVQKETMEEVAVTTDDSISADKQLDEQAAEAVPVDVEDVLVETGQKEHLEETSSCVDGVSEEPPAAVEEELRGREDAVAISEESEKQVRETDEPAATVEQARFVEALEVASTPPDKHVTIEQEVPTPEKPVMAEKEPEKQEADTLSTEDQEGLIEADQHEPLENKGDVTDGASADETVCEEELAAPEDIVSFTEKPDKGVLETIPAESEKQVAESVPSDEQEEVTEAGIDEPIDDTTKTSGALPEEQEAAEEPAPAVEKSASISKEPEKQVAETLPSDDYVKLPEAVVEEPIDDTKITFDVVPEKHVAIEEQAATVVEAVSISDEPEKRIAELVPSEEQEEVTDAGVDEPLKDTTQTAGMLPEEQEAVEEHAPAVDESASTREEPGKQDVETVPFDDQETVTEAVVDRPLVETTEATNTVPEGQELLEEQPPAVGDSGAISEEPGKSVLPVPFADQVTEAVVEESIKETAETTDAGPQEQVAVEDQSLAVDEAVSTSKEPEKQVAEAVPSEEQEDVTDAGVDELLEDTTKTTSTLPEEQQAMEEQRTDIDEPASTCEEPEEQVAEILSSEAQEELTKAVRQEPLEDTVTGAEKVPEKQDAVEELAATVDESASTSDEPEEQLAEKPSSEAQEELTLIKQSPVASSSRACFSLTFSGF